MAPARPLQLEAERLDKPPKIRERDVRKITVSKPRKKPPWIHTASVPVTDLSRKVSLSAVPSRARRAGNVA